MENSYEPPQLQSIRAEQQLLTFRIPPMVALGIGMFAGVGLAIYKGFRWNDLESLLFHIGFGGMTGYLFGACATAHTNGLKRLGVWK